MSSQLFATSALHRMVRYDARREIVNAVGDLSGVELFGTQVLIGPYVQSGLMISDRIGIPESEVLSLDALYALYNSGKGFLSQTITKESIYQGKVYLVLKIGSDVDIAASRYGDRPLSVGDWVYTLQENTRAVSLYVPGAKQSRVLKEIGIDYTGYPSKICYESDLYGRLEDPNSLV